MTTHRPQRAVLAFGLLAGVIYAVGIPQVRPEQIGIATDVYHHAARGALAGTGFYDAAPPAHPGYTYRYPPIVVLAFAPHALLGPAGAFAFQTVLNLVAMAGVGWLTVLAVEAAHPAGDRVLDRLDRALVVAFAVGSVLPVANLLQGQVNPVLALGIAGGTALVFRGGVAGSDRGSGDPDDHSGTRLLAGRRDRLLGGIAFGLAALVKPFLAVAGAWLAARRDWRAVAAATAAGVLCLAAGLVAFGPDATLAYVEAVLGDRAVGGATAGRYDPGSQLVTVRRQVAFLAPWLPSAWRLPVAAAVVGPVVAATYRDLVAPTDALVALSATLVGGIVLFPLEPFYLVLALGPLLSIAFLCSGWARRLVLAGLVLVTGTVTLATLRQGIALLGLPAAVGDPLLATARVAFAFVVPPTVGAWLILAGCVVHGVGNRRGGPAVDSRSDGDPGTDARPTGDPATDPRSPEDPPADGPRG